MAQDPLALPDLAVRSFGGAVVWANDELFAGRENLVTPGPAVFTPRTFGAKGQVYDGWETRRRRDLAAGDADQAIVRLGAPGRGARPWSSTPATSPATSRPRRRSTGSPSTAHPRWTRCGPRTGRRWWSGPR